MSFDDIEDFLGGGGRSLSFANAKVGSSYHGVITGEIKREQQTDMDTGDPLFWDPPHNRRPKEQLIIPLQLVADERDGEEDDGERRWFVKGYAQNALKDAIREAKVRRPEVGGKLEITFSGEGEPTKRGFNPPKFYKVRYWPPQPVEDFLADVPEQGNGNGSQRGRVEYARPQGGPARPAQETEYAEEPPF